MPSDYNSFQINDWSHIYVSSYIFNENGPCTFLFNQYAQDISYWILFDEKTGKTVSIISTKITGCIILFLRKIKMTYKSKLHNLVTQTTVNGALK